MATATATKPKKATSVKLQPLNDRVVVEREEEEEKTTGGLYLPDSAREKPSRGRVISVGNGRLLEDGKRSPHVGEALLADVAANGRADTLEQAMEIAGRDAERRGDVGRRQLGLVQVRIDELRGAHE